MPRLISPVTLTLASVAAAVIALPVAASAQTSAPPAPTPGLPQASVTGWPPDPIVPAPPAPGPGPTTSAPAPTQTTVPAPGPFGPGPTPAPGPAPHPATGQKHGPAPTPEMMVKDGGYTTAVTKVTATGTGGGTVYYPGNARQGEKFGGIVTIPGFMESGTVMDTIGKRLATHGFVVLVADALTIMDQPAARATQIDALLKALAADATVGPVLDAGRMAIAGHSMGGGGVTLAAARHPELRAVLAVHPWLQDKPDPVGVPTMVIAGGSDGIAPADQHADPIYASLTTAPFKALLTATSGGHWAGTGNDPVMLGRDLAFMKYFVDGDTRYKDALCSGPGRGTTFESTCASLR